MAPGGRGATASTTVAMRPWGRLRPEQPCPGARISDDRHSPGARTTAYQGPSRRSRDCAETAGMWGLLETPQQYGADAPDAQSHDAQTGPGTRCRTFLWTARGQVLEYIIAQTANGR